MLIWTSKQTIFGCCISCLMIFLFGNAWRWPCRLFKPSFCSGARCWSLIWKSASNSFGAHYWVNSSMNDSQHNSKTLHGFGKSLLHYSADPLTSPKPFSETQKYKTYHLGNCCWPVSHLFGASGILFLPSMSRGANIITHKSTYRACKTNKHRRRASFIDFNVFWDWCRKAALSRSAPWAAHLSLSKVAGIVTSVALAIVDLVRDPLQYVWETLSL